MDNIILEMKTIVRESKRENLSFDKIRNRLKEYLHYFVLDFIYNSEFKNKMIFYGGSCLRIVYDLPRMSIDLDFEVEEGMDFGRLKSLIEDYFKTHFGLKDKFYIKGEKKNRNVNRIFLNFAVMNEIGLSPQKDEVLKVRIDTMSAPKSYFKKLTPIFTLKSKYGKSFVIKHYDLPTLFSSKLAAVLDRPEKGFTVGGEDKKIGFKGRDFYDLLWYMEERITPNIEMLKLKGMEGSIGDIFDDISLYISKIKLKAGLKGDLEPLLNSPVDSFVDSFRIMFERLREERFMTKIVKNLIEIKVGQEKNDSYWIKFRYSLKNDKTVTFLFKLSEYFIIFNEGSIGASLDFSYKQILNFNLPIGVSSKEKKKLEQYIALFLLKINDYLKRHNNKVYFSRWESKFIRMTEDNNFNPEKQIIFPTGKGLKSKKLTLEDLTI